MDFIIPFIIASAIILVCWFITFIVFGWRKLKEYIDRKIDEIN